MCFIICIHMTKAITKWQHMSQRFSSSAPYALWGLSESEFQVKTSLLACKFFQNPSKLRCRIKCKLKKNAMIFKCHKPFLNIQLRRLLLLVETQDITSSFPTCFLRALSLMGNLINVKDQREPATPVSELPDILTAFSVHIPIAKGWGVQ